MGIDAVERVEHFQLNHDIDSHIYFCQVKWIDSRDCPATLYFRICRHCFQLAMAVTVEGHRFPVNIIDFRYKRLIFE